MKLQGSSSAVGCPVTVDLVRAEASSVFEELVQFCQTSELPFWQFEKEVMVRVAVLGVCLIRLFLTACHERLDIEPYLRDDGFRLGYGSSGKCVLWP